MTAHPYLIIIYFNSKVHSLSVKFLEDTSASESLNNPQLRGFIHYKIIAIRGQIEVMKLYGTFPYELDAWS